MHIDEDAGGTENRHPGKEGFIAGANDPDDALRGAGDPEDGRSTEGAALSGTMIA